MAVEIPQPGPEDLVKVNDALEQTAAGLKAAEKAQRAGIDVAAQVEKLKANESKLLAFKQVYFPNG